MIIKDVFENESLVLETFENSDVVNNWHSINGGSVEISEERSKIGEKSLKWNYIKGSMLRLTGYKPLEILNKYPGGQGIRFWIYNPENIKGDIVVRIGKSKLTTVAPAYRFKVHMDFKGWRAVAIRLNISAKTMLTNVLTDLDAMEIELPDNVENGVMYLDALEVLESVSYLYCADFQLPYLPLWSTGFQYEVYKRIPDKDDHEQFTQEDAEAFSIISERLDNYIIPKNLDYGLLDNNDRRKIRYNGLRELLQAEIEKYDSYNIKRNPDGTMNGPGLFAATDNDKPNTFMAFEKIWVALALDWKLNKNESSKEKLLDLFDHFNEQGWAEGSACGGIAFDEMRADGYVYALHMMQKELKEAGRLERELATLKWRSEFGYVFAYNDEDIKPIVMRTCDKLRSLVFYQLIYIIEMENSPLKKRYMKQYIKYINDMIKPQGGLENGIKKDYTLWHHQGPYMAAYGSEAMNVLCLIKYLLHDTCFDLKEESTESLVKALETFRNNSFGIEVTPIRLCGRLPHKKRTMLQLAVAVGAMAACGNREMAEILLDIWDENLPDVKEYLKGKLPSISWAETPGQMQLLTDALTYAQENNLQARRAKNGHFVFPYSGCCVYKKDTWSIAFCGWSCYIWDFESMTALNIYGRYVNYGSSIITLNTDCFEPAKGLDWSNIPGTTAKYLIHDELECKANMENRFHSDESFLGGITVNDDMGIFAMSLHDTYFDSSLRAKKSWFCFGDMIICIGTGIENTDTEHMTETTLFQCMYDNKEMPEIIINGTYVNQFENSKTPEKRMWVKDLHGNGYIIPDTTGCKIRKNAQPLKLHSGEDYNGESVICCIEHGFAPKGGEYEYVIVPDCSNEKLEVLFYNLCYRTLVKNESAHVVQCADSIGYVIFDEQISFDCGILKSTNTPCVAMETVINENEILLNLADPDLRMCDFPSESDEKHIMGITLNGIWEINDDIKSEIILEENENITILKIGCIDGKQTNIRLIRKK